MTYPHLCFALHGFSSEMIDDDWDSGFGKSVAVYLNGLGIPDLDARGQRVTDDSFFLCFNAHHEPIEFTLPPGESVEPGCQSSTPPKPRIPTIRNRFRREAQFESMRERRWYCKPTGVSVGRSRFRSAVRCLGDLGVRFAYRLAVGRSRQPGRGDLQIGGISAALVLEHLADLVVLLLLVLRGEVLALGVTTGVDDLRRRASTEQNCGDRYRGWRHCLHLRALSWSEVAGLCTPLRRISNLVAAVRLVVSGCGWVRSPAGRGPASYRAG